jgi:hypothetical protein
MCAHIPCRYMTCKCARASHVSQLSPVQEHIFVFHVCMYMYKIVQTCIRRNTPAILLESVSVLLRPPMTAAHCSAGIQAPHVWTTVAAARLQPCVYVVMHVCKRVCDCFSQQLCMHATLPLHASQQRQFSTVLHGCIRTHNIYITCM